MNHVERIVEHFLNKNEQKQLGNYVTNGKVLLFVNGQTRDKDVIAIKFKDITIGNSSALKLEDRFSRSRETEVQRLLSTKVQMIPFEVFKQANLDLSKFKLLDKGQSETLTRIDKKYDYKTEKEVITETPQHFTGASLFKVDSEVFLFDVDRNEINNGIINPFLVKLSDKTVTTIKDAYESLKPEIVKDAEKQGLEVKRQGEWFFIPIFNIISDTTEVKEMFLRAGNNRPNRVEKGFENNKMFFVKGKVSHTGREHKDINLKVWHQAIPNTATTSWTVTGDID